MPRAIKKRVIIDTNCWISFLIGKRLSCLLDLLSNETVQVVVCTELMHELRTVTARPKFARYFRPDKVRSLLDFIDTIAEHAKPATDVQLCRDPADDYLLGLAASANADYLLTGDQDLLVLGQVGRCRIVDIATFERLFAELP